MRDFLNRDEHVIKTKWHLSQGLGDEQEDKGKCFKESLKCFKNDEKKGNEKKGSLKMLRLNHGGSDKTMGLKPSQA